MDQGYGIRDTGYGIRDTGYGIRDTGYGEAAAGGGCGEAVVVVLREGCFSPWHRTQCCSR
jgi:hypothetical protein